MRAISIWAWHQDLPGIPGFERIPVCSDGSGAAYRMGDGAASLRNAGWDMALSYASLEDLAAKLTDLELPEHISGEPRTLQRGELQRLAIDCHGTAGTFYPNGVVRSRAVNINTWARHADAIRAIGLMTSSRSHRASSPVPPRTFPSAPTERPASSIIIMACNTGGTARGSRLLQRLSYQWPGRYVVGFSVTVAFPLMSESSRTHEPGTDDLCIPPVGLDTGLRSLPGSGGEWLAAEIESGHVTATRMPWAAATAENAKIARDGAITQVPRNENPDGSARHASISTPGLIGPRRGNVIRPTLETNSQRIIV